MRTSGLTAQALLTGSLAGLAACAQTPAADSAAPRPATYLGTDAVLMGGDLVQVTVRMKGGAGADAVNDYARCAAAGFAVKNRAGFARNVRTLTDKEGGVWHADAVYSITSALPKGLQTIDAEVAVDDCSARGVPTE